MSEKMLAVMKKKKAPGSELVEVDIPEISENEVLVKIKACSIYDTDVHIYNWDEWSQYWMKSPVFSGISMRVRLWRIEKT